MASREIPEKLIFREAMNRQRYQGGNPENPAQEAAKDLERKVLGGTVQQASFRLRSTTVFDRRATCSDQTVAADHTL